MIAFRYSNESCSIKQDTHDNLNGHAPHLDILGIVQNVIQTATGITSYDTGQKL